MNLFLATGNPYKIKEISSILDVTMGERFEKITLMTVKDLGEHRAPVEDGTTFLENALKKGLYYAHLSGEITLADDSGLEVKALNGRPGIHSARYAATNPERIEKLLEEMREVPEGQRQARFICTAVLMHPEGFFSFRVGYCHGRIAYKPRGQHGFGFDPVFLLPELGKTMAELTMEEKNKVSHRSHAVRQIVPVVDKLIDLPRNNNHNKIYRVFDERV